MERDELPLTLTREEWAIVLTWFGACDSEGFCDGEDYELVSKIREAMSDEPA